VPQTDYEALVRIQRSWSGFLEKAAEPEPYAGAARVVYTSRREVPTCDAIALREGELVIAARREHDDSLIRQDLSRVTQADWDAAFGPGTVRSWRVVSHHDALMVLGEEITALGLQVQRLTALVTGNG
jgi:hypothetical protein